ncbi:hypothetical protein J3A83DRAFT_4190494 [Scleroderma citrinum]
MKSGNYSLGRLVPPVVEDKSLDSLLGDFWGIAKKDMQSNTSRHNKPHMLNLTAAIEGYHAAKQKGMKQFIFRMGLSWNDKHQLKFLAGIQDVMVVEWYKADIYPPKGYWWYEKEIIKERWEPLVQEGKQADKRKKQYPLFQVNQSALQHYIGVDEQAIIKDSKTDEIIAIILRNFCKEQSVLTWVDKKVHEIVAKKKSVRLEDPGKIVLAGYTAGSLSVPQFDWARNLLLSQSMSSAEVDQLNFETSSIFVLLWNLCRAHLPLEVIGDVDKFLNRENMVRMGSDMKRGMGHTEQQPYKYAFSWTTGYIGGLEKGGLFYISNFGICISLASNTLIVWQPKHVHGTSLQDRQVDNDPDFSQAGLAIVTSSQLPRVWHKYWDQKNLACYYLKYSVGLVGIWGVENYRALDYVVMMFTGLSHQAGFV